jgi:hypothetical protein
VSILRDVEAALAVYGTFCVVGPAVIVVLLGRSAKADRRRRADADFQAHIRQALRLSRPRRHKPANDWDAALGALNANPPKE